MARREQWSIVAVDLDGTLIHGTTACLHLGDWIGHRHVIEELERRFAHGEITNTAVADGDAPYYEGRTLAEVATAMASVACIDDIDRGVSILNSNGVVPLICTVTWTFAAQCIADRFGFAGVCGTEMGTYRNGRLSGRVKRYFEPEDKAHSVAEFCAERNLGMDQVVAVGDGRSDIPLFREAGFSVALNASPEARAAATTAVDSRSFMDALQVVPGLLPGRSQGQQMACRVRVGGTYQVLQPSKHRVRLR